MGPSTKAESQSQAQKPQSEVEQQDKSGRCGAREETKQKKCVRMCQDQAARGPIQLDKERERTDYSIYSYPAVIS